MGTAVNLTGANGQQSLIDVKLAGDGTAFALWREKAAGSAGWDIRAAVKAAGSNSWNTPQTLVTARDKSAGAGLTLTSDGGTVMTWLKGSSTDGLLAALTSSWDKSTGS
ncbi:hypothetical protein ABT298_17575 [Streptomyces sp. NPDC001034]|uniref:hypothetical protein n=1 Tax=Streptomyces sp. NPDC001034 TaxID=3154375 RepID=UPI003317596C